jgi:ubiquinone/menaquinone biosynthesis C-methylase UbiE
MFVDPTSVVKQLGIVPGMKIADLGAAVGQFTYPLAKALGNTGKVYAVEIQKDLLQNLATEARKQHLGNVTTIWGDIDNKYGTRISDGTLDMAVIANVLFQIENKEMTAKEVHRLLKPQGRVAIIDWSGSYGGMGPQSESVIREPDARALFEKEGFRFIRSLSTGAHHWGILLSKT